MDKSFDGKEVWFEPTGNNARYDRGYKKGRIVKVARVFVTFTLEDSGREDKCRFDGNRLIGECNSGYIVYETEQDIIDHKDSVGLAEAISDRARFSSHIDGIGLEKLKKIAALLGI